MSNENALERIGGGALAAPTPAAYIKQASAMSKALADVIDKQKLYANIQGKKYVVVEGWTTLAGMMGVVPYEESNIRMPDGGYEATVSLRRASDGTIITQASAECGTEGDGPWLNRADFAKRSMAATRATSKACRLAFSWVMQLAGYMATPAEEMLGQPWAQEDSSTAFDSGEAPSERGQGASQGGGGSPNRPACPKCEKPLFRSKYPDPLDGDKGYYCWKKQGGCGAKFKSYDFNKPEPTSAEDILDGEVVATQTEPEGLFGDS